MPLTLRPAEIADIPTIAKLMNIAYRGTGGGGSRTDANWTDASWTDASWTNESDYIKGDRTSEASLREELARKPDSTFLIAEIDSDLPICGCVWLEPLATGNWYLGSLSIDPQQQNSGLGRSLLQMAEQWAKNRGARVIEMHVVNVRDTLIAWYERRGYHLTGVTHPFPYGDHRFGTPLRDDLGFVVLEKQL